VRYLTRREWVETADDLLWRRSKMGLHVSPTTQQNLVAWLAHQDNVATRQESA
jgi:glycerol-3-phosphate dehydrogenase